MPEDIEPPTTKSEPEPWLCVPLDYGTKEPQHWLVLVKSARDGWLGLGEVWGRYDAERLVRKHNEALGISVPPPVEF
jgi:hypothetical protein